MFAVELDSAERTQSIIDLHVLVPVKLISAPSNQTINETDTVTFVCNISANPAPVIKWYKDKLTVGTGDTLSFPVFRNQSGYYWCSADNGLNVTVNASAYLNVHYKPTGTSITSSPTNNTVLRNSSLVLSCRTDANPAAHIYNFYFNGTFIGVNNLGRYPVAVQADGEYTCVPLNTVGIGDNATFTVIAVDAPLVDVFPAMTSVPEGNNITLSCNASGKPGPVIAWTKVGSSQVLSHTSLLSVVNVSRPETADNMIQYQCKASNGVETPATATVNVTVHFPPDIDHAPSDYQVVEGRGLILFCNATGNPKPNITWTKQGNNSELSTSETLTLSKLTREDDGSVFECTAQNYITSVKAMAVLTVWYQPSVTSQQCLSPITEGDNVTLHCSAIGNPVPSIAWIRARSRAILTYNKTLIFRSIARSESVGYECLAWNGIGNNSTNSCSIDVHYLPKALALLTTPINTTALDDTAMKLNCTTDANPDAHTYHFYFNGNLTGNSSSGVFNISVKEDGEYTCVPVNKVGTGSNASVSITAVVAPSVDLSSSIIVTKEGSNISLSCNVSGKPEPSISWTRIGSSDVLSVSPSLTVVNVSRPGTADNMIQYQCTASNGVETPATATVNVTVEFPPDIYHAPSAYQVVEGRRLILFCNATGNPKPNITWTKQGNNSELSTSERLTITNVLREDDQSVYKCIAANSLGLAQVTPKVTVLYPPQPFIQHCPSPVTEGDNVTLYCNGTGNPSPQIAWIKSGKVLVTNSVYVIRAINRGQAGIYQCMVWNGIMRNVTSNCSIDVHYPSLIESAPVSQVVLEGNNLTLHCNASGNPTPNITWTKEDSPSVLHQGITYSIVDIDRNAAGNYTCTAWNGVGGQKKAIAAITVHYAAEIVFAPKNKTVLEYDNVTFFCNASSNPPSQIIWTQEGNSTVLHKGETFVIENVSRKLNGQEYKCRTWNNVTKDMAAYAQLTVHYPSTSTMITTVPTNTTVLCDSAMSLSCNADANPSVHTYQFYFNGNLIGNSSSGVFNITVKEDGEYTCVPVNSLGAGSNASVSITSVVAPSVDVSNSVMVTREGNNISLSCNVSGKPKPSISWTRIGSSNVLSVSPSLTIVNVSRPGTADNMIQYQCTASNGVETPATATVNITVHFPPDIDHAPSAFQVVEGSGLILFCNASGTPKPNITWTKQRNSSELSTSETLTLPKLTREDDGSVFECTAANYVGLAQVTAQVTVLYPPQPFIQGCLSLVSEGDNVTLYCNGTGNPSPHTAWIQSGKVLVTDSVYIIRAVNRSQAGIYQCMAWNGIRGNDTANCTIDVQYHPTSTLITILPTNTTVLHDRTVSLNCSTDANPDAHTYHWYFNGNLTGNSSSGVFNITVKEDGEYTCVPENKVGTGSNASVGITAVVAPVTEVFPQTGTVIEGGNITLICNVSGVPSPSVVWTEVGSPVILSRKISLTVANVTRPGTRDNLIQYQCTARNGVGTSSTTTVSIAVHYLPEIARYPSTSPIIEGGNTTLVCQASGNPQPNITWTKRGSNKTLSYSDELSLYNLTRFDDKTEYKCKAMNYLGFVEASASVTIHYPSLIESASGSQVVLEGNNLTLHHNARGNPTPNITWTKDYSSSVLNQGITYSIVNIGRNASGNYTCTAWNGIGGQKKAIAAITVHYAAEIVSAPRNRTVLEYDNVTFFCNASSNPPSQIIWTQEGSSTVLHTEETFIIENVSRKLNGQQYKCRTWNNVTKDVEAYAQLTVHYPPTSTMITALPTNTTVLHNTFMMLNCSTDSHPDAHTYHFYFNGNLIGNSSSGMLYIPVKEDGEYTCIPVNIVGTGSNASVGITAVVAPVAEVVPRTGVVVEGGNITLICNSSGVPSPSVVWTQVGTTNVLSQNNLLRVVNVTRPETPDNMIQYQCTASNGVGTPGTAAVNITVQYPPEIVRYPSTSPIIEGGNITLVCQAIGNPQPNITWTKRGSNKILSHSKALVLANLTRLDNETEYKCKAMNYLGFVEASTLVTIHYSSLIESSPINQVVLEGNNLTLRCSASGNPTPNITWTKDKSSLVLHQGDTYSIVDIDRNAAGNYTCTAWNGVGEQKKAIAAVSVHFTRPKDQVLWLGENTTLVCDAVGNPVPNITYSVLGENASVVYSKTLVIKSSSVTYVKMYTCTAFNGVQPPVSVNATVTVLVRPCSRSPCANGNCTDIKTPPSYRCTCPSGYQGRHCIQQITKETDRVRGSVKLERCPYKYHPDYNNHSSEMYKELSNDFIKNMIVLYENEKQFGLVTVNDI
ncbi:hemicentin-1-like isoform X4 [Pocillopora verrucosa]